MIPLPRFSSGSLALLAAATGTLGAFAPASDTQKSMILEECQLSDPKKAASHRKKLKLTMINDGFCDCHNGVDEPGTDACAGIGPSSAKTHSSLFFCPNIGSKSQYIYSSHVNDGICDCCDGSDEKTGCENSCKIHGESYRQKRERLLADIQSAKAVTEVHTAEAQQKERTWEQEIAESDAKIKEMEAEEGKVREAYQIAENAWMQEQLSASTTTTTSTSTTTTSSSTVAERKEEKEDTDTVSEYAKWMDKNAGVGAPGGDSPEGQDVSEYAKWMDKNAGVGAAGGDSPEGQENEVSSEAEGEQEEEAAVETAEAQAPAYNENDSQVFKNKVDAQKTLDEVTAKLNKYRTGILSTKEQLEQLQKYRRWYSLIGKCLSTNEQGYTYKICLFTDAKQDYTGLGRFKEFTSDRVMRFEHGDMCHGGPARSLQVTIECGLKEEITQVSEPERCGYAATITHPAACSADMVNDEKPEYPEHYAHADEL